MKIAQVAPLVESVPPKLYGGTERVVYHLTEELVRMGHEVTLFASGDSCSSARLVSVVKESLRLNKKNAKPVVYHIMQLKKVMEMERQFDIVHFHIDYLHFPFMYHKTPRITTLHGRLDVYGLPDLYKTFPDEKIVSISRSQRRPVPDGGWIGNVYHGLPHNLYTQGNGSGGYLTFIGRTSKEKGLENAIRIAMAANIQLKIAAKIDPTEEDFFEYKILPLLNHPLIEFLGEIDDCQKSALLGNALALLFPIQWPEPFGMVMIEAMACGTPVVAFAKGSVPEIIENGITGYMVNNVDEAVSVLDKIPLLSRTRIRMRFEERFTARKMAEEYIRVYHEACNSFTKGQRLWMSKSL